MGSESKSGTHCHWSIRDRVKQPSSLARGFGDSNERDWTFERVCFRTEHLLGQPTSCGEFLAYSIRLLDAAQATCKNNKSADEIIVTELR